MKKLHYIFLLSFALILTGCNRDNKAFEPYSPLNTTSLMKLYANEENYEQFKALLMDGLDEESMKQMYDTVRRTVTDSASIDTFTLVTFDNGKTLLVHVKPKTSPEDEEVLIQNIIELPAEMAEYIQDELNE